MDTQQLEIVGRNYLTNSLIMGGFEVAEPIRDRGVDLIAFMDIDDEIDRFVGIPIQLKASSKRAFSIDRKYNKFPDLIMAYVWDLRSGHEPSIYALTQAEAVGVADIMGYSETASWQEHGKYSSTRPSAKLVKQLAPYRIADNQWRQRLLGSL